MSFRSSCLSRLCKAALWRVAEGYDEEAGDDAVTNVVLVTFGVPPFCFAGFGAEAQEAQAPQKQVALRTQPSL